MKRILRYLFIAITIVICRWYADDWKWKKYAAEQHQLIERAAAQTLIRERNQ